MRKQILEKETLIEDQMIQKVVSPASLITENDILLVYVRFQILNILAIKNRVEGGPENRIRGSMLERCLISVKSIPLYHS
jgi:hypothetical protein